MSFDHDLFRNALAHRLEHRHGFNAPVARQLSLVASEVICETHGSGSHYIQARILDAEQLQARHADGETVAALAKDHGVSVATVRRILKKPEKGADLD